MPQIQSQRPQRVFRPAPSTIVAGTVVAVALAQLAGCGPAAKRNAFTPSPEHAARQVAERVLKDFPEPPPFDWGEGVLLAGMMHAGTTFHEPRYIGFVKTFADHWARRDMPAYLKGGPTPEIQAYCGYWGPAYALLMLNEHGPNPDALRMAQQVADFIIDKATRTNDGGLGHWGGNRQLWVDTLYMVCPTGMRLSDATGRPEYRHEALRQLEIYRRHTLDGKTGLYWHMYDEPSNERKGVLWARGNGWVAMSYVETIAHLNPAGPERRRLAGELRGLLDALLKMQDRQARLWHTVLDRPDTYLETSASAMILSSLAHAHRLGIYTPKDPKVIAETWAALATRIDDQGRVIDVSAGTMPDKLEAYATKIKGTYTWGTGAFLIAASAMRQISEAR